MTQSASCRYDKPMKLDLFPLETWETLNRLIKTEWVIPEDVSVRVFSDLPAAVYEVAQGTAQFLSHKRSLALVKGQTFVFQPLMPYFYKEAYLIQNIHHEALQDVKGWVDSLKKDTLFVLFSEDHPVTGEKYAWDEMDQLLNEKRIFSIRVSHNTHFFEQQEIRPYSLRVCSFSNNFAVSFCGNKFKSPPLTAPSSYWGAPELKKSIVDLERKRKENKELIQKFESNLPAGFEAFLKTENRIYDRSVIFSKEVNGEAIQQYLNSALKLPSVTPGSDALIETTSLCRWGGTKGFEDWWEPLPNPQILRGMMILDVKVLENPQLLSELGKALDQCRI